MAEALSKMMKRNLPALLSHRFSFDSVVDHFQSLQLPGFAESEGPLRRNQMELPSMRPHWLAELAIDLCVSGIEHAEPSIQHRASSLLHELFWSQSQEGMAGGACFQLVCRKFPDN
jgi:hypothetical protein